MHKDFVLITGHGIFPAASILQVVPVTDVSFEVALTPPDGEDGKFVFTVIRNTDINVEVARANPTKKNEVETLTDYGFTKELSDSFEFAQDEFLEMLGLSDDDELKGYLKDYNRRLKKSLDYQKAITAIESNPGVPDYESSLDAVKRNAPGDSYVRKQDKTLSKIQSYVLEAVLGAVENASEDDDYTGKKLIDTINSDDSLNETEDAANNILKKFYNKNFSPFGELEDDIDEAADDEPDFYEEGIDNSDDDPTDDAVEQAIARQEEAEKIRHMADEAVDRADAIRSSPHTITNKDADEG